MSTVVRVIVRRSRRLKRKKTARTCTRTAGIAWLRILRAAVWLPGTDSPIGADLECPEGEYPQHGSDACRPPRGADAVRALGLRVRPDARAVSHGTAQRGDLPQSA